MQNNRYENDVAIISGDGTIESIPEPVFEYAGLYNEDRRLVFKRAYEIKGNRTLDECVYRVGSREFTELSCMRGSTIQEEPNNYEIREHEDGTKGLFHYTSIPTFDISDREWSSMRHMIAYRDGDEIILIECTHGYYIPSIKIYMGLVRSTPRFTKWMEIIGCSDIVKNLSE